MLMGGPSLLKQATFQGKSPALQLEQKMVDGSLITKPVNHYCFRWLFLAYSYPLSIILTWRMLDIWKPLSVGYTITSTYKDPWLAMRWTFVNHYIISLLILPGNHELDPLWAHHIAQKENIIDHYAKWIPTMASPLPLRQSRPARL